MNTEKGPVVTEGEALGRERGLRGTAHHGHNAGRSPVKQRSTEDAVND